MLLPVLLKYYLFLLLNDQNAKVEEFDFKEQYQTFNNFGYAVAPDGSGKSVGNKWLREKMGGKTIFDTRQSEHAKELKRRREATGDGIHHFSFLTSFGCIQLERTLGWLYWPDRRTTN